MFEEAAREEGLERGLKEGIEQGLEQGKLEKARYTALNMHRKGYSSEIIAELLEVSIKNVQQWIIGNEKEDVLTTANY